MNIPITKSYIVLEIENHVTNNSLPLTTATDIRILDKYDFKLKIKTKNSVNLPGEPNYTVEMICNTDQNRDPGQSQCSLVDTNESLQLGHKERKYLVIPGNGLRGFK